MKKIIVIGAGLGGLETAYIMAKNGCQVTVLEKQHTYGGALQSFCRKGEHFDTGFHYVGGIGKGDTLYNRFEYLNLLHLPWHRLNTECFDRIIVNGNSYAHANGHLEFAETLAKQFPHEKESLYKFVELVKQAAQSINGTAAATALQAEQQPTEPQAQAETQENIFENPLYTQSTLQVLQGLFKDRLLIDVIGGSGFKIDLTNTDLPFFVFAEIFNSYIESAWRLDGPGSLIADSLVKDIRSMNGQVICNEQVVRINTENGLATGLTTASGKFYPADIVVSDAEPASTLNLIQDPGVIRNIYKRRIESLDKSLGMFTVNIRLKPESVPYINSNLFIFNNASPWSLNPDSSITDRAMVFYRPCSNSSFCNNIDLLAPMPWSAVEQWKDTTVGHRGADYEQFKQRKANELINLAAAHIETVNGTPFTECIESISTSTPLTWQNYTGTPCGSAFGIVKKSSELGKTMLSVRTPVDNLIFTGQSINLHGVMGVTMTAWLTCQKIDYICRHETNSQHT